MAGFELLRPPRRSPSQEPRGLSKGRRLQIRRWPEGLVLITLTEVMRPCRPTREFTATAAWLASAFSANLVGVQGRRYARSQLDGPAVLGHRIVVSGSGWRGSSRAQGARDLQRTCEDSNSHLDNPSLGLTRTIARCRNASFLTAYMYAPHANRHLVGHSVRVSCVDPGVSARSIFSEVTMRTSTT